MSTGIEFVNADSGTVVKEANTIVTEIVTTLRKLAEGVCTRDDVQKIIAIFRRAAEESLQRDETAKPLVERFGELFKKFEEEVNTLLSSEEGKRELAYFLFSLAMTIFCAELFGLAILKTVEKCSEGNVIRCMADILETFQKKIVELEQV